MSATAHVRLVLPHQLFVEHLDAPAGSRLSILEQTVRRPVGGNNRYLDLDAEFS